MALSSLGITMPLWAQSPQGTYTNFETPQTHPIEVVTIGSAEFILVCNTPNDSLEIWKAAGMAPTFVTRVGVGLGPGTVRWNATLGRAFVCNFDGDSVSIVSIQPSGTSVTARLISTTPVGDEPADIAFNSASTLAAITLSSSSKVQYVQPDMTPTVSERLDVAYADSNGLYTNPPPPPFLLAVKMPRALQWTTNDRLFVLNLMGGQELANTNEFVDVDLWRKDAPTSGGSTPNYLGQIGTTNHAFALTANGSRMFIVGTRAQNRDPGAIGVNNVRDLLTGFVQSWLTVVDIPSSGNMSIRPEAGAGISGSGGFPDFPSINFNKNYSVGGTPAQEVASYLGVSQPTDIDLFQVGTNVTRIAVAGFHTDNVALLTPLPNGSSTAGGYTIKRVNLVAASDYGIVGPRGVAFDASGAHLYVNGRFDNTLRVIDTSTLTSASVNLQGQDPTPADVRVGRQFLYSTRFSRSVNSPAPIKSGFVSCASCHVDGRTDGLSWDLSDPAGPGPRIPAYLIENPAPAFTAFPNPKGRMITQTLQGLVNYLTNESYQFLTTNAPYHWRGDRNDFTDFNEAFVNLQRMPNVGTTSAPRGLSTGDMVTYRRFVNTIRHPPNPEQSLERVCTGSLSNPNSTSISGSGSLLGRALFHNFAIDFGTASCVTCHSLPDGSTNTITLEAVNSTTGQQPIESASLRNVRAREAMVHTSTLPLTPTSTPMHMLDFPGTARVSNDGLTHAGIVEIATGNPMVNEDMSINRFASNISFFPFLPGNGPPSMWPPTNWGPGLAQMGALIDFVRELDSGEAPAAGVAHTVTNVPAVDTPVFTLLEEQVNQGNIGLGVRSQDSAGVIRGFWFDPLNGGRYRDVAAPLTTTFTRVQLLASFAGTGKTMVLQGTPPGTERRWASPTGAATAILGSTAPTAVQLEKMAPDTFFEGITDLTLAPAGGPAGTTGWAIQTLRSAVSGSFGIPSTARHEPPRRFRVSGYDIRPGARLFLFMQNYSPSSGVYWEPLGMEMALVPTKFTIGGRPVWETTVEMDEQQTLALLNGGPFDPRVRAILDAGANSPVTLPNSQLTNLFAPIVLNEDGTASSLSPTPTALQVQDTR